MFESLKKNAAKGAGLGVSTSIYPYQVPNPTTNVFGTEKTSNPNPTPTTTNRHKNAPTPASAQRGQGAGVKNATFAPTTSYNPNRLRQLLEREKQFLENNALGGAPHVQFQSNENQDPSKITTGGPFEVSPPPNRNVKWGKSEKLQTSFGNVDANLASLDKRLQSLQKILNKPNRNVKDIQVLFNRRNSAEKDKMMKKVNVNEGSSDVSHVNSVFFQKDRPIVPVVVVRTSSPPASAPQTKNHHNQDTKISSGAKNKNHGNNKIPISAGSGESHASKHTAINTGSISGPGKNEKPATAIPTVPGKRKIIVGVDVAKPARKEWITDVIEAKKRKDIRLSEEKKMAAVKQKAATHALYQELLMNKERIQNEVDREKQQMEDNWRFQKHNPASWKQNNHPLGMSHSTRKSPLHTTTDPKQVVARRQVLEFPKWREPVPKGLNIWLENVIEKAKEKKKKENMANVNESVLVPLSRYL